MPALQDRCTRRARGSLWVVPLLGPVVFVFMEPQTSVRRRERLQAPVWESAPGRRGPHRG